MLAPSAPFGLLPGQDHLVYTGILQRPEEAVKVCVRSNLQQQRLQRNSVFDGLEYGLAYVRDPEVRREILGILLEEIKERVQIQPSGERLGQDIFLLSIIHHGPKPFVAKDVPESHTNLSFCKDNDIL